MERSAAGRPGLEGKRVAFTGRLACMTRGEAAKLVKAHGGTFGPRVTPRTSLLIIGQEGWPLQKDGRLTAKLQKAQQLRRLGYSIQIVPEQEFLDGLGLDTSSDGIHRLYTLTQLAGLLAIPRSRLRSWINTGLIRPNQTVDGLAYFDYGEVISAKALWELTQTGVTTGELRRSLEQLRALCPDVKQPLSQLAILESNGQLLMRVEDGLIEPSGQRHFDFSEAPEEASLPLQRSAATAEEWFDLACEHEDSGRLAEAVAAYRQALLQSGPDRDACFNLANVLYALGRKEQAAERYYQALELDRNFVEGWNNLGVVLSEFRQNEEARLAFEKALELNPQYADVHYNLADLLESMGRHQEAQAHWQAYARQDLHSPWAKYARKRCR